MTTFETLQGALLNRQRRWLVTGAAGFIGSNIVQTLLEANQFVIGLDNFSTGFKENLEDIRDSVASDKWQRFTFVEGDIRNLDTCRAVCKDVEFVLHQAALGSVSRSILDPRATHETNINGFFNVLNAVKEFQVERLVYAASSSTYGDHPDLPKLEDKIGKPLSPYAVTKLVNEIYADIFSKTYGLKAIGLRYFNVFGKRQNPRGAYAAVIPKWITSMFLNENVIINGDGETSRDFCYINNVVQANVLAAFSIDESLNQVYNVALGDQISLNQLFRLLQEKMMVDYPWVTEIKPEYRAQRDGDVRHSRASIEKARKYLGYHPTHKIEDGLTETIQWYKNNRRINSVL